MNHNFLLKKSGKRLDGKIRKFSVWPQVPGLTLLVMRNASSFRLAFYYFMFFFPDKKRFLASPRLPNFELITRTSPPW